jgi:hypothetical protein
MTARRHWLALLILAAACDDPPEPDDFSGSFDGGVQAGPPRLHLRIVDSQTRAPLPAMVTLVPQGAPASRRLRFGNDGDPGTPSMGSTVAEVGTGGAMLTYHGVAVWRGEAVIPIGVPFPVESPRTVDRSIGPGRYHLIVNRGMEYDLTEADVDLTREQGEVFLELPLTRVVSTPGYLAADMHVHSAPGSNDSRLGAADRLKSMAVAGVEVVVATDHDHNTDLGPTARKMWPVDGPPAPLVTIAGNEASSSSGHFNVFPVEVEASRPAGGAPALAQIAGSQDFFDRLRALPNRPFLQMNHTRLGFAAYFDDGQCGPWLDRSALPSCSLDFDAMEVLSGYLMCGTKIDAQLADWYALLGFGLVRTAAGNSDTHGTSNILGGFPRTYVKVGDDDLAAFREQDFMSALRGHHAVATSGPFLTLRVNEDAEMGDLVGARDGQLRVSLRMQAPSWVNVDEVRLLVDGKVVKSWPVPRQGGATPLLEIQDEPLTVNADAFVTAEASGKKALPAFVVGDYTETARKGSDGPFNCPASPGAEQGMAVFAVTNPVFVDFDGDGLFRGPRQPASYPVPTR